MSTHKLSVPKRTIFGSRKLHRLYKIIMANRKLSIAIMAIVTPLVSILITSDGLASNYFVELRKMLTATPFGKKIAELFQQLVDVVLRMLGIGIQVGDVVEVRESFKDETFLEKDTSRDPIGLPSTDQTYAIFQEHEFIVYRIRNRTVQLIKLNKLTTADKTKKSPTHLTKEDVKKMSLFTAIEYPLLCNKEAYKNPHIKQPNPDIPFGFPIDHFKKTSDTQLDAS